jgi:hyperosmotically inducible protein
MNADRPGASRPARRLLRRKSLRAARAGVIVSAALLLAGCALAMLNGAASSGGAAAGGSASGGSPSGGSASGGATASRDSRTAAQRASDDAISTSVRSKLAVDPALKAFNLSVDTHDGIVTLRGQVANVEQRNAAQLQARAVKGVKSVQNRVTVR